MYAGWDFVLYALLLVVVVLWNFFSKVLRRRRRELGEVLPPLPVPDAVPEAWGRAPTEPLPRDWEGVATSAPRAADRPEPKGPRVSLARVRTNRWRTRAELRRSLMDMAVLGPPRALAPWDGGGAEAEPRSPRG